MNNYTARLGRYFKFICRRERISSVVWILSIALSSVAFASLYPELLPTQESIVEMAALMDNPAMVAMMGNVYGMEELTQASLMAHECLVWFLIAAAIMNVFIVNRHTRADEEPGRLEMFRALPVGRLTGGFATITFAFFVDLIISVLTAVLLIGLNIGGTTITGAFVYGFAIGAVGFAFAGLTLFLAQLFSTSQTVSGVGIALIGLFYIMRAVGDVNGNLLSYISPIGLALKVEAFFSDAVYPLIILFAIGAIFSATALAVCAVRDHGSGIIPAKKGKSSASPFLKTPLGFAFRLTRSVILGWGIGLFLLGASYGSVSSNINDFVSNNEMMMKIIETGDGNPLLDGYVSLIFLIMSMVTSIPVILTAIKIHAEEKRGRLEQIFGRAVERSKLFCSFIIIALIESVIMQAALSVGLSIASGGELALGNTIIIGFVYLPAIWIMTGFAVFLAGVLPRLIPLVWAVFVYSFTVMYFGRVFNLPEWAGKISPFGNIPQLPVQDFNITPIIILTVLSGIFIFVGVFRFSYRDIG